MKKVKLFFIFCLSATAFLGLAPTISAYDLGVGALADRLADAPKHTFEGFSSPYAEIVVVDPASADKVIVVAEIEIDGEFRFSFNYPQAELEKLQIFGIDELGITSRVPAADFLADLVVMPPTIVNDREDQGVRNLAIKGMTYPGSKVTISFKRNGTSEPDVQVDADSSGRWSLNKSDLQPGKYVATAISRSGGRTSRASQELSFEIPLTDIPTEFNLFWLRFWQNLRLDPRLVLILVAPFLWWHLNNWSLWRALFGLLGLLWPLLGYKKRKKVGVAYDAVTKEPVKNAWVVVYESETHKRIGMDLTNTKGEFNFDLSEGEYFFVVRAGGYNFPSKLIKGKGSDGQYANIYHGEKVVLRRQAIVELSVPLDPIEMTSESWFYTKQFLRRFGGLISWVWIGVCVFAAVVSFLYIPDFLSGLILAYYILLLVYLFIDFGVRARARCRVVDGHGVSVPEILVSVYAWPHGELAATRVSDLGGEFGLYLDAGEYRVEVTDDHYSLVDVREGRDGIISHSRRGWLKLTVVVNTI